MKLGLLGSVSAILVRKGAVKNEYLSKGDACGACQKHEEFLSGPKHIAQTSQGCRCTATDVNAAFANDATKKTQGQVKGVTTGSGDDLHHANEAITENTGAARLAQSWKWHCGAITAGMNQQGESTWQEC